MGLEEKQLTPEEIEEYNEYLDAQAEKERQERELKDYFRKADYERMYIYGDIAF